MKIVEVRIYKFIYRGRHNYIHTTPGGLFQCPTYFKVCSLFSIINNNVYCSYITVSAKNGYFITR